MRRKTSTEAPPSRRLFGWLSLLFGTAILLATSLFWAILSARVQNYNADQVVDGFLFETSNIFGAASFPGAHSFLIKWPLFALSAALGNTTTVVTVLTVACALIPVAALALALRVIERRNTVLCLWFLALSCLLLLVPAQPAPGVLLPVNFAMFTTRNLEYAVLLAIVGLLVRSRSWRSPLGWLAVVLAIPLIASDGIFAPLLVGASGLAVLLQLARLRFKVDSLLTWQPLRWLVLTLLASVGAAVIIKCLVVFGFTDISTASGASPYGLVHNVRQLTQAVAYSLISLMTLFGANPAYDHAMLSGWVQAFAKGLTNVKNLGYVGNLFILAFIMVQAAGFSWQQLRIASARGRAAKLASFLLLSGVVASAIYALTDHYYPVDARYLAVWFFALTLAAAVSLRAQVISRRSRQLVGLGLLILLPFAISGSYEQYIRTQVALQSQVSFHAAAASLVQQYHVDTLVGNYWDVMPIRQQSTHRPTVVPLADCTIAQTALASRAWRQAQASDTIAYLLNAAPQATGYPVCSLAQISAHFGKPTRIIPVKSDGHPDSQLLIYDNGMRQVVNKKPKTLGTVSCTHGSLMQIVAHEDDDILFMNPDLQATINQGSCVTTVFMTAGDAGAGNGYAHSRREGSYAAYATMYHRADRWSIKDQVIHGQSVTIATLQGVPRVSLIFLNLPDGNVTGKGFKNDNFESLARLQSGSIGEIAAIEGHASYDAASLEAMLLRLMNIYRPNEIRTLNYSTNQHDGDHSDHHAAGYFATQAFRVYGGAADLKSYIGYTGRSLPANVGGVELVAKEATFFAYGAYDGGVCTSVDFCNNHTAYGTYLARQYSRVVARHVISSDYIGPHNQPSVVAPKPAERTCVIGGTPYLISCPPRP